MKQKLAQLLDSAIAELIAEQVIPRDASYRLQLSESRGKEHGDLACNIAMMLAKSANKPPRELAQALLDKLPENPVVAKAEIAGPGFLNFWLASDQLGENLNSMLLDSRLGIAQNQNPETVVIDYSSPNLAKEMHIGHIRSTAIGDALARTLEFLGNTVIRQNHVGDWGTQFGMLLAYLEERKKEGDEPGSALADLEVFYRQAKTRFDESEDFADRARAIVVALQSGDQKYKKAWAQFIEISLSHCQSVYDRLGVQLTRASVAAESDYNDDLDNVVADLKSAGLLQEDAGAQVVFLPEFSGRDGQPQAVIIQKNDGGYLYATTDLAAIRHRVNTLKINRALYVVDARQGDHFKQVFKVAEKAKFLPADVSLEHIGFGTINGKDGKPFKTREGGSVKLSGVLDEAESRAYELVKEKNPDEPEETLREIARVVGIASIKYADLSKNRNSDYIFDWDQMLSFDGNTAPYLLYAYTRIQSIFERGGISVDALRGPIDLAHEKEQKLAKHIMGFAEVVNKVGDRGMPHLLATWLYELAVEFSSFYEACGILNADTEALKQSRLSLTALTAKCLKTGLNLLGLETLDRM